MGTTKLTCIDNLPKCNAECCRMVHLSNGQFSKDKRFWTVHVLLCKDDQWYYKLHGVKYARGILHFPVEFIEGNKYKRDCDYLVDCRCKGHPDKKPLMCQRFGTPEARNTKATENCIYK